MLERFRVALVRSFVGAIALGFVFSQSILHIAYIFSAPITRWLTRREYPGLAERSVATGFQLGEGLPELIKSFSLLLVGYLLLRWLYFERHEEQPQSSSGERPVNGA